MSEKEYQRIANRINMNKARLRHMCSNQQVLPAPVDEPTDEPVPEATRRYLSDLEAERDEAIKRAGHAHHRGGRERS